MMFLSVVVPLHNEFSSLQELTTRLDATLEPMTFDWEIILVDDASTDDSGRFLDVWQDGKRRRALRLTPNRGQWGATKAGLGQASGEWVAVLDGDLQDPPETLVELCERGLENASLDVIFAVKSRRNDPRWMRLGARFFHFLQNRLSKTSFPSGAGSYCLMRGDLARRIASLPVVRANLASVIAALQARSSSVIYEKHDRRHGDSRVGFLGLTAEALESLALTGALQGMAWRAVLVLCALTVLCLPIISTSLVFPLCLLTGVAASAWLYGAFVRRRISINESSQ